MEQPLIKEEVVAEIKVEIIEEKVEDISAS